MKKFSQRREAGILMAMVLGEKYLLGDEINSLSGKWNFPYPCYLGLDISLVGAAVYFCFKKIKIGAYDLFYPFVFDFSL